MNAASSKIMTSEPVSDGVCVTREPTTDGFGFFFLTA